MTPVTKGGIAGRVGTYAARRPRLVIGLWLALIVPLSVFGINAQTKLHSAGIAIPGTPSAAKEAETAQRFGPRGQLLVLLDGNPEAVKAQRGTLESRLARQNVSLVGPLIKKESGAVLLIADMRGTYDELIETVAPRVRKTVEQTARPPVRAYVAGLPDTAGALADQAVSDLKTFELLAVPLLILILVLVFRTPMGAAIPLIIGVATISAANGVLMILHEFLALDVTAVNLAGVMGLALGVDYSLLLVSRFREEMASGKAPEPAAEAAAQTAGHTVLTAAIVLLVVNVTTIAVAPGDLLISATIGVNVAVILSMIGGVVAVPALLSTFGHKIDEHALFGRAPVPGTGRFATIVSRPLRRPHLAAGLVLIVLGGLSVVALGLKTGPLDYWMLPPDVQQRQDYETIQRVLGPSWSPPYSVLLTVDKGTMTDPGRLKRLADWQNRLARRSDVAGVLGPGVIEPRTRALAKAREQTASSKRLLRNGVRDQRRLSNGLARANAGVRELRAGLSDAEQGAQRISGGGSSAAAGARQLDAGLDRARSGSQALRAGLVQARAGASALATGAQRAASGSRQLASGLATAAGRSAAAALGAKTLADGLRSGSADLAALRRPASTLQSEIAEAQAELAAAPDSVKSDVHYRQALDALATANAIVVGRNPATGERFDKDYDGLAAAVDTAVKASTNAADGAATLRTGVGDLRAGLLRARDAATALSAGAQRLASGARLEASGLGTLADGAAELDQGIDALGGGGRQLLAGVQQLQRGAGRLATGLGDGVRDSAPLRSGLTEMQRRVSASLGQTRALSEQLGRTTQLVQATRSGYMTLAIANTGPASEKAALGTGLNLERGGNAAIVSVMGQGNSMLWGHPLREVLERESADVATKIGATAYVGGTAAVGQDFDHLTATRLPILVVAVSLITWLALTFILRSMILAGIAVVLNLLTVGASFGVLVLGFNGAAPLGGGGYVDSVSVIGTFGIVFSLSIDYALFLLQRMRESYDETGDTEAAIAHGLRTTAGVVTGAAVVMVGVFAAFASAQMINLREMGVGLVTAILIDATLVRLILLPAAIRLFGDATWREPWFLRRRRATTATVGSALPATAD